MLANLKNSTQTQSTSALDDEQLLALMAHTPQAANNNETSTNQANNRQHAFSILMARHLDKVRALAWRTLQSHADTDEVAQEVFLKIWHKPDRFKPGKAKFSTWLFRVTLNACIDRQRKTKTVPIEPFETVLRDEKPTPEQALSKDQQNQQRGERVNNALQNLPDRQRQAIILSHFEGISNIEAAQILDTSVEAVESLLGRARRSLKAALAKDIHQLLETGNNR